MQVILLEKIGKLGELGQHVNVKPGYGRNFLIPKGKAVLATSENVKKFELQRADLEKAQGEALAAAQTRVEKLNGLEVTLLRKTASEEKLFGSVGANDIAIAITEAGVEVSKHDVRLPEGPFKMLGEYQVEIHLHADVNAQVKLIIAAEGS